MIAPHVRGNTSPLLRMVTLGLWLLEETFLHYLIEPGPKHKTPHNNLSYFQILASTFYGPVTIAIQSK
ncbi:hypothetical protein ACB092_05G116600 [Castanea dentata]